uniref:AB hydrolase-1 domain-containing protein n=1 Tax=Mycena chlorophos TaxID=658473 RepID=A0ABQ0KUF8_MYCCL|nr:predicted protein [Mycena chlorophos]
MASSSPTFLFVPGVCHTPAHCQPLLDAFHARGYSAEAVALPTVGSLASTAPLNADVNAIRDSLERLVVNENRDVVLVCHSYGGVPGSQAVKGFERSRRMADGTDGGIVQVVFLAAMLPKEGESTAELLAGVGAPKELGRWLEPGTENTIVANKHATEMLFHDLDTDAAAHWTKELEPMSTHTMTTPAVGVCWDLDVPKVYIVCKQDRALWIPGVSTLRFVERVNGGSLDGWSTLEMDCGHSPFLSHIHQLVDMLTRP